MVRPVCAPGVPIVVCPPPPIEFIGSGFTVIIGESGEDCGPPSFGGSSYEAQPLLRESFFLEFAVAAPPYGLVAYPFSPDEFEAVSEQSPSYILMRSVGSGGAPSQVARAKQL